MENGKWKTRESVFVSVCCKWMNCGFSIFFFFFFLFHTEFRYEIRLHCISPHGLYNDRGISLLKWKKREENVSNLWLVAGVDNIAWECGVCAIADKRIVSMFANIDMTVNGEIQKEGERVVEWYTLFCWVFYCSLFLVFGIQ